MRWVTVGGRDSAGLRYALLLAKLAIIPIGASNLDAAAMTDLLEVVEVAKTYNPELELRVLLTRVDPRTKDAADMLGFLDELKLKVTGEASAIGVTGLFRAPYADRWRLAFDARQSADSGIVVGAHACALTAGAGTLLTDAGATASLAGVQCNR